MVLPRNMVVIEELVSYGKYSIRDQFDFYESIGMTIPSPIQKAILPGVAEHLQEEISPPDVGEMVGFLIIFEGVEFLPCFTQSAMEVLGSRAPRLSHREVKECLFRDTWDCGGKECSLYLLDVYNEFSDIEEVLCKMMMSFCKRKTATLAV